MSRKTRNILIGVGAFLLAVLTLVLIGKASGGFTDFEDMRLREPNEKNLWQSMTIPNDGKIASGEHGLTVKVNEDGQVKINGTSEEQCEYVLATGTLAKNTSYVFKSGLTNGTAGTVHIVICRKGDTSESGVLATSYNGYNTIDGSKLTQDTEVEVVLIVNNKDVSVSNVTLEPVLCVGTEEADLVKFWK